MTKQDMVSKIDIDVKISNVEIKNMIGKGSFGNVYAVVDKISGNEYALKEIVKSELKRDIYKKNANNEVVFYKKLKHRNIINTYDFIDDDNKTQILMDKCDGGDLIDKINGQPKMCFNEKDAKIVIYQVLKFLKYLHKNNTIHLDLKPENIIFKTKDCLKDLYVIDFGLSIENLAHSELENCFNVKYATSYYLDPLIFDGYIKNKVEYNCKNDIWSLGIILYCMISGSFPVEYFTKDQYFNDLKHQDRYFKNNDQYFKWTNVSHEVKDLIKSMLNLNLEERPTAKECLKHPWLSDVDDEIKLLYKRQLTPVMVINKFRHIKWSDHQALEKKEPCRELVVKHPSKTPINTLVDSLINICKSLIWKK